MSAPNDLHSFRRPLTVHGVDIELAEIPSSGQWPMYANAPAMWPGIIRSVTSAPHERTCAS